MADTIPPILIKLAADVNDLKAGLSQAQNALKGLDDNVKKTSSGLSSFVGRLKSVGAALGATFAATQLSSFAKDTVMAASSMAESVSKVNVVFGEGASEVLAFGQSAATNLGISNQAAIEAAGTYGNLFQAFGLGQGQAQKMSTTLVQLAADMASFNNTSVDDAILALRSGLSGETEPLKRFGVALSEVRLKEEALRMGLIKTMSGTLPVAIKSQAAYSLILKDTALSQGDYARTADGTANTMKTLAARFQDAKVALGNALMPAFRGLLKLLNLLIPVLQGIGTYFTENAEALKKYGLIITSVTVAWGVYKLATGGAIAITKAFNAVILQNPIFRFVSLILLAGAGFVKLYNNFESFRKIVDGGLKLIVKGFGYFIGLLAKIVTVLSKLPGGGIFKGMAAGLDQAAISAGKYANAIGKTGGGFTYQGPMSQGGKPIGGERLGTAPTTSLADEAKKKAADEKKRLSEIKSLQKKYESEQKQLANFEEKKAKLIADYQKDVAKRNAKYDEDVIKAKEATAKRIVELEKDYNKQILDAQKDAAEKRREIVQQSIDRLRDVFKSASAIDVGKMFADLLKGEDPTKATTTTLVDKFKQQLADIRLLAANATALSNKGFTQVFVEQVVAQGTEVGNKLAAEILAATPETITELQGLFTEIQKTSETGVDVLGKTMYDKLGLATEELKSNYTKVGVELNEALAQYAVDFAEAMAEAQADLVETLAELKKDLQADLAEMQDAFHVALAEINKDIAETISQINALIAAMAALGAMAGLGGGGGGGGMSDSAADAYRRFKDKERADELAAGINITNNVTSNVTPDEIDRMTVNSIKYGSTVIVGRDR